jgi:transposase-like protein
VRRTASEKLEIIRLVEGTDLPIRATLRQLGVPRSTFYGWYQRYVGQGFDGLHDKKPVLGPAGTRFPRLSSSRCSTWL